MPSGFATHPGSRPLALIAAALVVLQAFVAGVATAQHAALTSEASGQRGHFMGARAGHSPEAGSSARGAVLASDPIDVICHGTGGTLPADPAPDAGNVAHLCCAYCTAAVPALAPPDAPGVAVPQPRAASRLAPLAGLIFVISHGVVRAGLSQAPPASA